MSPRFLYWRKVKGAVRIQLEDDGVEKAGDMTDWRDSDDHRGMWAEQQATEVIHKAEACAIVLSFESQEHANTVANNILIDHNRDQIMKQTTAKKATKKELPRVVLGCFAPPIKKQIKAPERMTTEWQKKSDAILLLYVQDYITDKQKHTLSQRLLKEIKAYMEKQQRGAK